MRKSLVLAAAQVAVLATIFAAGAASAAEVEVKMLDRGTKGMMVFEPALVKINPGDTVKFVPVSKGHNVETIPGMAPAGAAEVHSKPSQEIEVKFDKPGVYGFKCKPHYGMGMVSLVVVGNPANLAEAKAVKHPGKAKQVFAELFNESQVASR